MLFNLIEKIVGSKHTRDAKRLWPVVHQVNARVEEFRDLSDEELKAKTGQFKTRIQERVGLFEEEIHALQEQLKTTVTTEKLDFDDIRNRLDELNRENKAALAEVLNEILPEAFAAVKETCRRLVGKSWKVVDQDMVWDMVPFDVQIMGGIVLHEGKIAEMATGEGKTLVATMPLYLNALTGKGAHLVTVNDYLARRDCEWMGEIFKFLGLTVAFITNDMEPPQRQKAYAADITYGTNNEFGFDYLRDNMAISLDGVVQRKHHYAIIDEVDSVLIDEARTPLIISGPVGESKNKYGEMKPKVEQLVRSQTVLVNRLVAEGEQLMQQNQEYEAGKKLLQAHRGGPKNNRLLKLYQEPGVQKLIRKVEADYMIEKKLPELDEELLFVIDEKAHTIDLTEKGRQAMSPGQPEMFNLPDLALELAKIDETESDLTERLKKKEAFQIEYAERSERLHNISQLLRAYSLFEKDVEYVVTEDKKVMIVDEFTGRLMPGRRYSDGLHQALEAKENVQIERETQTLATITLQNFFRLYNKLGGMTGTAETEAGEFWEIYKLDVMVVPTNEPIRREDAEDVVYRTRREKYNAIIEEIVQCHERRQPVLVGTVSVEVSETLSRMLKRRGIHHSVLNAKYHKQEAEIVSRAGEPGMVTIATNMAGRGTDIKLGGGVIVFTEKEIDELTADIRDEAKHGRAVFVHELPGDEIKALLPKLDGVQVRLVESIQEKKELLADPSSTGVIVIPKPFGGSTDTRAPGEHRVHVKSRNYAEGGLYILGTERHEARRIDRQLRGRSGRQGDPGSSKFFLSLEDELMRLFGSERIAGIMDRLGLEEGEVITHSMVTRSIERAQKRVEMRNFEIRKHLLEYDDVMNRQREVVYHWRRRALEGENLHRDILDMIGDYVRDSVELHLSGNEIDWEEFKDAMFKTFLLTVPISPEEAQALGNGETADRISEAAVEKYEQKTAAYGSLMSQLERFAVLKTIDELWKEHLYEMDLLKEGIGLRAYGQKDPLLEYKQEGFTIFSDMLQQINQQVLEFVFKAQIQVEAPEERFRQRSRPVQMSLVHEESAGMGFAGAPANREQGAGPQPQGTIKPVHVEHKAGRNDPCPCGSGKKYKHCHGAGL